MFKITKGKWLWIGNWNILVNLKRKGDTSTSMSVVVMTITDSTASIRIGVPFRTVVLNHQAKGQLGSLKAQVYFQRSAPCRTQLCSHSFQRVLNCDGCVWHVRNTIFFYTLPEIRGQHCVVSFIGHSLRKKKVEKVVEV